MNITLFEDDDFVNPVPNGKIIDYGVLFDDKTGELSISEWVCKDLEFHQNFYDDEELKVRFFVERLDGWEWLGEEESLIERLITYGKADMNRAKE